MNVRIDAKLKNEVEEVLKGTVKESRGRLSYLTPDRTKPITARKLGDDFDKATVLALLTQNARRAAEQTKAIPEYPAAVKKPSQGEKTTKTTPADNTLQRMVDRDAKVTGTPLAPGFPFPASAFLTCPHSSEIGRASCRERV